MPRDILGTSPSRIYIYIHRPVRSFEIHLRLERFFNRKLRFISLGANINFIFYRYFYPPFLPSFLPSFLPVFLDLFFFFHSSFYRLIENEMELSLQVWIGTEGNDFYFAASKWNRLFFPLPFPSFPPTLCPLLDNSW